MPSISLRLNDLVDAAPPPYELVRKFDYFSRNANGAIHLDDRAKTYLMPRPSHRNLLLGFQPGIIPQKEAAARTRKETDYILNWTQQKIANESGLQAGPGLAVRSDAGTGSGEGSGPTAKQQGPLKDVYGGADIVTNYKALQQAGETPFAHSNWSDQDVVATKHKGVIYLCHSKTSAENDAVDSINTQKQKYSGLKFAHLMTARDPTGIQLCRYDDVTSQEKLYDASVFALGETKVFVGAGVDSIDPTTGEVVELRTIRHDIWNDAFNSKIRYVWLNLHLMGMERVVFGKRDYMGDLRDRLEFRSTDMPGYAAEGVEMAPWEPRVCMAAIHRFLGFVKEQLDGTESTYKMFQFRGGVMELFPADDPRYHFLNQGFLDATMDIP